VRNGTPALLAALVGLSGSALAYRGLTRNVPSPRWQRTNHAGAPVTLLEGPAYVLGATLGAGAAGPAGVSAVLGAGAFGALDDLAGDGASKGLKGHLGAAARGRLTTGFVKVVGIGATGVVAAALADRERADVTIVDTVVGGAVVAAAANLVNLLDLRPGRALKATVASGGALLIAGGGPRGSAGPVGAAGALGAALGVLAPDLRGEAMLGDTGANAAGALVGVALVERTGRAGRLVALGLLTALTLASEKVSFTAVIESTPVLREVDAWGRPPR